MQSKETKKWQDEEALKRYQMIAPLLDESLDEGKRRQLREEIAERYDVSKRSIYRYCCYILNFLLTLLYAPFYCPTVRTPCIKCQGLMYKKYDIKMYN